MFGVFLVGIIRAVYESKTMAFVVVLYDDIAVLFRQLHRLVEYT